MNDVQSVAPLDPEQQERTEEFAGALQGVDKRAVALALGTGAFALAARGARAQAMPPTVTEVLNFALTLEYLEREFYVLGVDSGVIPGGDALGKYTEIRNHEQAHVALLENALGGDAIDEPEFDFTAGNGSGEGPFDPFNNYAQFLVLSQGFEDTGVRAYKGGAPALIDSPDILTTALQIHSVEARHASVVRRLVADFDGLNSDQDGWIDGDGDERPMPGGFDAIAAVYAGESDTTVADINISGVPTDPDGNPYSNELVTEAYDEPLGMDAVLSIADPFIVDSDDSGDDNDSD